MQHMDGSAEEAQKNNVTLMTVKTLIDEAM